VLCEYRRVESPTTLPTWLTRLNSIHKILTKVRLSLFGAGPAIGPGEYEDDVAPKAFLNYILFDENFNLLDFGYDQISNTAKQIGITPVVAHDYLNLHVLFQQGMDILDKAGLNFNRKESL
jgi:hypothetical protein